MGGQNGNRRLDFPGGTGDQSGRQQTFLWGARGGGWLRLALTGPGVGGGGGKGRRQKKKSERRADRRDGRERSVLSRVVTCRDVPWRAVYVFMCCVLDSDR